jgi:hypothetical protein
VGTYSPYARRRTVGLGRKGYKGSVDGCPRVRLIFGLENTQGSSAQFREQFKASSDSRELQVGIVRLFTPSLYETPYLSTRNDPKVGTPALRMGILAHARLFLVPL